MAEQTLKEKTDKGTFKGGLSNMGRYWVEVRRIIYFIE